MSVFDAVMLTAILIYAFMFAITFVLELTAGGESVRVAALSALVFLGVMTALGGVIALLAFAITSMWSGVSA